MIVKEACDEIDIVAITIKDELEETVENHLQSEPMKRVISSNALNYFTKICDSNAPNVAEKVEATAKEILESDTWLKEYVQTIAAHTVVYDKLNVQALVDSTVQSSDTKKAFTSWQKRPVSDMLQQPRMLSWTPPVKKVKNVNDSSRKNRNKNQTTAFPELSASMMEKIQIERGEEKWS